jgi:uncharacterized protein (UPF0332 family)
VKQAKADLHFAEALQDTGCDDLLDREYRLYSWVGIISYYAMYHTAEALLARKGVGMRSHAGVAETLSAMQDDGKLDCSKDTYDYSDVLKRALGFRKNANYVELRSIGRERSGAFLTATVRPFIARVFSFLSEDLT